jgi:2-oxo-3-hexenedioate decarboxylase
MYDTTVAAVAPGAAAECPLAPLLEPHIEPEIGFRLAAVPEPGMDAAGLLNCIDGVVQGYEIVHSIFPGWKFKAPDTVAAFALHGRYFHLPFVPVNVENRADWLSRLSDFRITLMKDGAAVATASGANVLDGPLQALGHFVRGLEAQGGQRLKAGDMITTGTVTRPFPVAPGETWSTAIDGLPVAPMTIRFV